MADVGDTGGEREQDAAAPDSSRVSRPSSPRRRVQLPEDEGHPIDRIIREAMAEGKFDNLPGQGKPIPIEPSADPRAPAFRILRNAGLAPEWVDLERAIEKAQVEASEVLAEYAARREG